MWGFGDPGFRQLLFRLRVVHSQKQAPTPELWLPILLGGAKELGIVYINRIRGAKERRNLQTMGELACSTIHSLLP